MNFQVLLLVVSFYNIVMSIFVRHPPWISMWLFRKKLLGILLWKFDRPINFTLERNRKKMAGYFSLLTNAENRKKKIYLGGYLSIRFIRD